MNDIENKITNENLITYGLLLFIKIILIGKKALEYTNIYR